MSWGGRGRDDETRERMIDAARRSGMSVSELVKALAGTSPAADRDATPTRRRRGEAELDRPDPRERGDRHAETRERQIDPRERYAEPRERGERFAEPRERGRDGHVDIDRQLDALAERLRDLSAGEPSAARPRVRDRAATSTPATTLEEIAAAVERLSRQIPEPAAKRPAKARPQTDVAAVLAALDGLDRRVKAMNETSSDPTGRDRRERGAIGDLDRAIAEISQRQTTLEREKRPRRASASSDIERHFRELSDKIEQLRSRDERNSPESLIEEIRSLRQFIEQRAGGVDIGEEIRKLTGRIDEMASQHPERSTLEPLMTEMGRLRDVVLQTDVEGSLKSLEAGYGHIVDRLDDLKRGLSHPRVGASVDAEISEIHNLLRAVPQVSQFSSIEQSLRDLAEKVERSARDDEDATIARLEKRLGEIKSQIDRVDPSSLVKALDQRLKVVTDKLDSIEKAARGPVAADRIAALVDELRTVAAGSGTNEELRALETRLGELSDRIADLDRRRPSFDDTDRLHDRIAEIAGKLDRMAVPVTDRRTVDALEATISRLDELMSRQRAPVPDGMVDGRVAELIDRLDRGGLGAASSDIDALGRQIAEMRRELTQSRSTGDLEAEMRKLAERLERSVAQEPDEQALDQIEEQLARISRQLEVAETRFDGFADIEATIRRLGDRLEGQQVETLSAAREAAREMVRELDLNRGESLGEEALRGLQDDLRSLRSAARDSESRTNDTLISLHDALTGIVGRLTAIEKIAQGSARSAAARPAATEPAPAAVRAATVAEPARAAAPAQPMPVAPAVAAPAAPVQPAPGGVASAIARAREALAAGAVEATRPLEPGSGKPAPRVATVTPPTASMTPTSIPRTEPAPAGTTPSSVAAARKADFIAAARRAAQAAAGAAEAPITATAEDRTAAPVVGEGEASSSGALSRIGQVLKNRRRPLLLATGALVLAVMTLRLIPGGGDGHIQETAEAPAASSERVGEQLPPSMSAQEKRSSEHAAAIDAPSAPAPTQASNVPAPIQAPIAAPMPQVPAAAPVTAPAASAPMVGQTPAGAPIGAPVAAARDGGTIAAPAAKTTTQGPQAGVPAGAATSPLSAQPAQRTSALSRPMPDASLLDSPTTTGSIGGDAAAPSDAATLPAKIGSEKLRRAAASGDPRAAFEVGMRYAEGRGVAADAKAAADWYAKAAEKGLAPAQYRWAVALEKGIGVTRDSDAAKRWYASAAEAGNVRAMHNLGVLHANARDIGSALPWFQKAADLGLKDSQFNLGIIHALGSGVKQDLAVSYKWFALAARQGDKEADKKMNEIATHLSKVDLAAARMAVQTWVQKPLDREANEEMQVWAEPREAPKAAAADDRDTVQKVQGLLKSRGLYGGPVDGQNGTHTRTAIMAFQKKAGRPATGEIDGELLQLLAGKSL